MIPDALYGRRAIARIPPLQSHGGQEVPAGKRPSQCLNRLYPHIYSDGPNLLDNEQGCRVMSVENSKRTKT